MRDWPTAIKVDSLHQLTAHLDADDIFLIVSTMLAGCLANFKSKLGLAVLGKLTQQLVASERAVHTRRQTYPNIGKEGEKLEAARFSHMLHKKFLAEALQLYNLPPGYTKPQVRKNQAAKR